MVGRGGALRTEARVAEGMGWGGHWLGMEGTEERRRKEREVMLELARPHLG